MKKLAFLGGAAGLGLMALLISPSSQAADHADALATAANHMADINDVYAWMAPDGDKINLALTVGPFDDGQSSFGNSVQYAFHLTRHASFPLTLEAHGMGKESKVICTFESNTSGQCWVVDPAGKVLDYVKGDVSATTGLTSKSGNLKVFAGPRSDPFFFNFNGFASAVTGVVTKCAGPCPGALTTTAGCPTTLTAAEAAGLRGLIGAQIATPPPGSSCPGGVRDCFATANVMALVVQVDKSLIVTDAQPLFGVWASTHAAP